MLIEELLNNY